MAPIFLFNVVESAQLRNMQKEPEVYVAWKLKSWKSCLISTLSTTKMIHYTRIQVKIKGLSLMHDHTFSFILNSTARMPVWMSAIFVPVLRSRTWNAHLDGHLPLGALRDSPSLLHLCQNGSKEEWLPTEAAAVLPKRLIGACGKRSVPTLKLYISASVEIIRTKPCIIQLSVQDARLNARA